MRRRTQTRSTQTRRIEGGNGEKKLSGTPTCGAPFGLNRNDDVLILLKMYVILSFFEDGTKDLKATETWNESDVEMEGGIKQVGGE